MPPKKKKRPQEVSRNPKEQKLFENLSKVAKEFFTNRRPFPFSSEEIMVKLNLPVQHTEIFNSALEALAKDGVLINSAGKYMAAASRPKTILGTLRVHPRGFGFLEADDPEHAPDDIFIPKTYVNHAVDGDKVEVEILNLTGAGGKGPDGRVVAIISRGRTHIAGIIRQVVSGTAVAYVPLLGKERHVVAHSRTPLKLGDRIVMKVEEWGDEETVTLCRVTKLLGNISDASKDIVAAIAEYELRDAFPPSAVAEAQSLGNRVLPREIAEREDLRATECFTIDPDTAKDFDDALSLSKDKKGHYHLAVHIADVSHYVTPSSALDREARQRCNSTYFPKVCVPMLPSELSENLCSLKEGVNRLTVSVLIHLDKEGGLIDYKIVRSVIRSAKRFTYREAKRVLDGSARSRHAPTLHLMVELCGKLKKKRAERGSIEFSLPEFVVTVDDDGIPFGVETVHYDITHQLVEEFMLKANEIVARHLADQGKNLTYRIHDEPAEENIKEFAALATSFGFHLPTSPTAQQIQRLFDEALTTPYGPYLATAFITRMRLASYSAENIGHYGLALTHYCHFTSPIRRYVDLVVHRLLFGASDERRRIDLIAKHCSDQERISAKAENDVLKLKKLRYLQSLYEQDPTKQYTAAVTRVKSFGFFFEVAELMLEGYFHVSELDDDFYNFDPKLVLLRGANRGISFKAGQQITVMLKKIDLIALESQWQLIGESGEPLLRSHHGRRGPRGGGGGASGDSRRRGKKRRR